MDKYLLYQTVGRYIAETKPQLYAQCLDEIGYSEPALFDYSSMAWLFSAYCQEVEISEADLASSKKSYILNQARNIFIVVAIKVYYPIYMSKAVKVRMPSKLMSAICEALNIHSKKISGLLEYTPFFYFHYADFALNVNELYERIVKRIDNEGIRQEKYKY